MSDVGTFFNVKFCHKKFVSDVGVCRKSGCQMLRSDCICIISGGK